MFEHGVKVPSRTTGNCASGELYYLRPRSRSGGYLAGSDDHDAADAGGVAAGFDFGDAARMAAEFAPILGGAPAGQRRH